jgi:hypothetical protein
MFDALFGGGMWLALKAIIAFVLVLALMAGCLYVVRRFGATALTAAGAARGRQPRLAVIEIATIEARHRLVLIRRDNVEHLIMIGGPTDVVIEPNIVRAIATTSAREVLPARATADALPRAVPLAEGGTWPLQPEPAPRQQRAPPALDDSAKWTVQPEPALRVAPEIQPRVQNADRVVGQNADRLVGQNADRQVSQNADRLVGQNSDRLVGQNADRSVGQNADRSVGQNADRLVGQNADRSVGQNPDRLAALTSDPSRNLAEPEPPPPPRRGPEPRRAAPPVQPPPAQALPERDDQNLAEMAHRLESALQRPRQSTEPVAEPAFAPAARGDAAIQAEPKPSRPEPSRPEPKPAAKPAFDNLEQEMASLLGRPSGKT